MMRKFTTIAIAAMIFIACTGATVFAYNTNDADHETSDLLTLQSNSKNIKSDRAFLDQSVGATSTDISNGDITLILYDNGQFTMKNTSDGKWVLFPDATSYISINVDGTIYAHDPAYANHNADALLDNYISTPLTQVGNMAYITYILPENVGIGQHFELNGKAVKFTTEIVNLDDQDHSVGVRYLFDTQLDQNDGSPLYAPGIGTKTYETDIPDPQFSMWKGYDIYPNPNFESKGSLSTQPDRTVFAWWPNAVEYAWDYTPDPNQRFYTPGYLNSPESDSCVLLYWNIGTLPTEGEGSVVTYYGTEVPSGGTNEQKLKNAITSLKDTTISAINHDTHQLAEIHSIIYRRTDGEVMGSIDDLFNLFTLDTDISTIVMDINEAIAKGKSIPYAGVGNYLITSGMWYLIENKLVSFDKDLSIEIHDILSTTYEDLDPDDPNLRSKIEARFVGEDGFTIDEMHGTDAVTDDIDDTHEAFISSIDEATMPDGFPYDEVIDLIKQTEEQMENSMSSQVTLRHLNPNIKTMDYCSTGEINTYHDLTMKIANAPVEETIKVVGYGTAAGIGVLALVWIATLPVSATASVIAIAGSAIFGQGVVITATQMQAKEANICIDALIGLYGISATYTYPKEVETKKKIFENTLDYVEAVVDNPSEWGKSSVEIVNIYIPDIILDAPSEPCLGCRIGYTDGYIDVMNTGILAENANVYIEIIGRHSKISFAMIDETVQINPGETKRIYFTYGAPDMQLLETCHQYSALVHVSLGTASDSEISERTSFSVGTQQACDASNTQTVQTVSSGEIYEGHSVQTQYTTQSSTIRTEYALYYPGSDLDLHIYDSQGNHVGVNYNTGEIENDIPNTAYSGSNVNPEWITIENSGGETYTTEVVAMQTNGEESYSVLAIESPELPALLGISPSNLTVSGSQGDTIERTVIISEYGGFNDLSGISITTSDLTDGVGGVIPSSSLTFDMPGTEVPAGSAMIANLTIDVPTSVVEGKTYSGVVTAKDASGAIDNASVNVAILATDLTVATLYPNGGESIPIGTQVQVSAHATDDNAVTSVTFYYSNNSGSNWNLIGAGTRVSGTAKEGTWNRTWNTNGLGAGSNYLIKVVASDGTSIREDQSDSTFSLTCTSAEFNGVYTDYGDDTNGDGLYDYLTIEVGVDVGEPGYYLVEGTLYDCYSDSVGWAGNYTYLNAGSRMVQLDFNGINIRQNGVDGTYDLKFLYLYDSNWNQSDYIDDAYTTYYYNYVDFQTPPAEFNGVYTDYGDDTEGDGLYDYLTIEVGVYVRDTGYYQVNGELHDCYGGYVGKISNYIYLNTGNQTVQLDFSGIKIRRNGVDGAYNLKYLCLYDDNWNQFDYIYNAYTTSYYHYTDFQTVPSCYNYTEEYVAYAWDAIDAPDQSWTGCDDCSYNYVLPWNFTYFCEDHSSIQISTNGLITFPPDTSSHCCSPDFENTEAIAPFWGDLSQACGQGTNISVQNKGDRVVVVWYTGTYGEGCLNKDLFEAILYETGEIRFNYNYLNNIPYNVGAGIGNGIVYYTNTWDDGTSVVYSPANPPTTTIFIADANAQSGYSATTQTTINNMTNFGAATVTLSYDPDVVQITDITAGDVGTPLTNINNTAGTATIAAYITTATGPDSPITFANLELLAVGSNGETSPLTLTITTLTDADGTPISATAESGVFTISGLRGDANDDGVVNVVDAMFVAQYAVGNRDASTLNMANADANLDGNVDVVDAMFIAQYAVGARTW